MTPEEAINTLWTVAANAVLIARPGAHPSGATVDDHVALSQARMTLAGVVEQWRATVGADNAERT